MGRGRGEREAGEETGEGRQGRGRDPARLVHNPMFEIQKNTLIFTIFFASGGKGALTPLTKILRTPLSIDTEQNYVTLCVGKVVSWTDPNPLPSDISRSVQPLLQVRMR